MGQPAVGSTVSRRQQRWVAGLGSVCRGRSRWSRAGAGDTGAALRFNLLLSAGSPLSSPRRGEAGEHGWVYSAVTAHVTGHCMCHLSQAQVRRPALPGSAPPDRKVSWPKLTSADSQIINFSLTAILCKHNTPTFLYPVPFSHWYFTLCRCFFFQSITSDGWWAE